MKIIPNCSCTNLIPEYWTNTPARVKAVVNGRGEVVGYTLREMSQPRPTDAYYCDWCGTKATVETPREEDYFRSPLHAIDCWLNKDHRGPCMEKCDNIPCHLVIGHNGPCETNNSEW